MLLRISLFLAIVAGLGGIYFANVPIKTNIKTVTEERDTLKTEKTKAESQLKAAKESATSLRTEFEKVNSELEKKTTDLENQTRLLATQRARADAAANDASRYLGEKNKAESESEQFRVLNMKPTDILQLSGKLKAAELERNVVKEENLILARELRAKTNELAKLLLGGVTKVELRKDLRGAVVKVDDKFEFVVLNIGTKDGVLPNGELLVGREGKLIAKVRVTSVTPDRSIANLVSDWQFGRVMEGDQVLP